MNDERKKKTICMMLEYSPGLDEFDISGSLEIPLMEAFRLTKELLAEGKIYKREDDE